MKKILNQIFFPPPKSEYFFNNIGNQNIFLEKLNGRTLGKIHYKYIDNMELMGKQQDRSKTG
jgi:hypothetical protein